MDYIEEEPIILTDRTTCETDWACGMQRWWYKHEGEKGIVPVDEPDYFTDGKDIHSDTELLIRGMSIEDFLAANPTPDTTDQLVLERHTRRMGWAVGFALYVLPLILAKEDVVAVEHELVLQRDPLWINLIPDLITRDKVTGRGKYREWKTTKDANKGWVDSWPFAIQLHAGIQAAIEEFHLPACDGQVVGFLKGRDSYGRLHHPYVYGYVGKGGEWQADYRGGLTAVGLWEYPGGILEWVKKLGPDYALGKVFPHSAPVMLDERMLESFVRGRTAREDEIHQVIKRCQDSWELRTIFFEQRFKSCKPVIGSPCPYLACCWNAEVNADPLKSGLYKVRTPHHELEIISQGEE